MTDKLSPRNHLYPRVCSVTGEGMMSGWVFGDGVYYVKHDRDVLKTLREDREHVIHDIESAERDDLQDPVQYGAFDEARTRALNGEDTDEDLRIIAYQTGYGYYTEWEEYDNGYYTFDGRLLVEVHTEKCNNCGEETEWTSVHEFCHHCHHPMT